MNLFTYGEDLLFIDFSKAVLGFDFYSEDKER